MSPVTQRKANHAYYMIVGIFMVVMTASIVLLSASMPIMKKLGTSIGTQECGCTGLASLISRHAYHTFIVSFIGLLASLLILYTLINLIIIWRRTVLFHRQVKKIIIKTSPKLLDVAQSINLQHRVREMRVNGYPVFCHGFIQPEIYVASTLVNSVSKNQLRAILLHEKNHLQFRDPLKIFLTDIMKKTTFFIPGIRHLINDFEVDMELAADERATNNLQDIRPLSKALLTVTALQQGHQSAHMERMAATFVNATEVRIETLLNQHARKTFRRFMVKLAAGVTIALAAFFFALNSQALQAKTYAVSADPMNGSATQCLNSTSASQACQQKNSCGSCTPSQYNCSAPQTGSVTTCTSTHYHE